METGQYSINTYRGTRYNFLKKILKIKGFCRCLGVGFKRTSKGIETLMVKLMNLMHEADFKITTEDQDINQKHENKTSSRINE